MENSEECIFQAPCCVPHNWTRPSGVGVRDRDEGNDPITVLVASVVVGRQNFRQGGCVATIRPLSGTAALIISSDHFGQSLEEHRKNNFNV